MSCKVCATLRKLSDRLAAYRERKRVERQAKQRA
jgi:hypothetical protein